MPDWTKNFIADAGAAVFLAAALLAANALCHAALGHAEEVETRSPVTLRQVREAVARELYTRSWREAEMPGSEDLELPFRVPIREEAGLRVRAVCWDQGAARARFRLECQPAGACLPFVAYVRLRSRAGAALCGGETALPAAPNAHLAPVVRAGDRGIALFLAAGLRVSAPVTFLERGSRGDIVRVRGSEGRVFRARITGPAQAEALP